jgi:endonuclease/exonuclease/phosphatase family metal-dependent hydrolase
MDSILVEEFQPQKFNSKTGFWNDDVNSMASITATELTFVTYNVWFGDYYLLERCEALLKIVHDCNADAIALQEVTPSFLEIVLKQEWIQNSYYISDTTGETIEGYGVMLLSRIPIRRLFLYKLPSSMRRKLLVAELCVNGQFFNVATVHLESLKSSRLRAEQLSVIFPLLSNSEHCVLVGDFNFCSSWKRENANIIIWNPMNTTDLEFIT